MFYKTDRHHGLPYNPFKALVAPRPIGWISTVGADGVLNLAPYSYFNAIGDEPPMVVFSSTGYKDTVANVKATGEFVCNLVTKDLSDAMNASSAAVPDHVSEFELAGVTPVQSELVSAPRVGEAKAALECKAVKVEQLRDIDGNELNQWLVTGQVVGVYISDDALEDGRVKTAALQPLARLGYMDYSAVDEVFSLKRPGS
ncbi:flavin reductase family protein [Rhodobacteraceae bacterium RKSG542]|uniref:flavin reductase family protein n=1 Tax=Pseudovibrio flavus TaxID=2529854 RepID=UPI0012BBA3F7|nr:flavin reductase family protein [Pseudovibrio flavus]MTI19374.1 flavin reductase family protein [Pseudovibrio flavus]